MNWKRGPAGAADAPIALSGTRVFDGTDWHSSKALLLKDEAIQGIAPSTALGDCRVIDLDGGILAPGFVDLQVNGGGGVLLNDSPGVETIRTICRAHAQFGTTALLPTLITDTPAATAAALEAGRAAGEGRVEGFLGLHLEGPHLSVERKGAHEPRLIRAMEKHDAALLIDAAAYLDVLLVTLAPEIVATDDISALAEAEIIVSLGHSNASYRQAADALSAGARLVTHLFNAMSPFLHRAPGLPAAALEHGPAYAGLIADGIHVDPAAIAIALRAKKGPGRIFLVTDAMATAGSEISEFKLNGRTIRRADGRLTLDDGSLAGADLDMISAVRFMHRQIGLELGEALRMASLYPAEAVRQDHRIGRLATDYDASLVHLSEDLLVRNVWIRGRHVYGEAARFSE
jgi:N-acetylglucosamine-6-phosphate deacetylase